MPIRQGDTSAVPTAYRGGDYACRIHGLLSSGVPPGQNFRRPFSKTLECEAVNAGLFLPGRMAPRMHAHLSNLRARVRTSRAQNFHSLRTREKFVCLRVVRLAEPGGLPWQSSEARAGSLPLQRSSTGSGSAFVAAAGSWLCNWVLLHIRDSATLAAGSTFQRHTWWWNESGEVSGCSSIHVCRLKERVNGRDSGLSHRAKPDLLHASCVQRALSLSTSQTCNRRVHRIKRVHFL